MGGANAECATEHTRTMLSEEPTPISVTASLAAYASPLYSAPAPWLCPANVPATCVPWPLPSPPSATLRYITTLRCDSPAPGCGPASRHNQTRSVSLQRDFVSECCLWASTVPPFGLFLTWAWVHQA